MLIKLPPSHPASTSNSNLSLALNRPQFHTRKNHDDYNGTDNLPLAIHVHRNHNSGLALYTVTLFYAHNRACELYRSDADCLVLRRAVTGLDPGLGEVSEGGEEEKMGKEMAEVKNRCFCSCCPYPLILNRCGGYSWPDCCDSEKAYGREEIDTMEIGELERLLQGLLVRIREGVKEIEGQEGKKRAGDGDGSWKVALEWFLRRRRGDCGGR